MPAMSCLLPIERNFEIDSSREYDGAHTNFQFDLYY